MKHIHKYFKNYYQTRRGHTRFTWMCSDPICTHFMPHNVEDMITNMHSICWQCGNPFRMTIEILHMDKPMCIDCRRIEYIREHHLSQ